MSDIKVKHCGVFGELNAKGGHVKSGAAEKGAIDDRGGKEDPEQNTCAESRNITMAD